MYREACGGDESLMDVRAVQAAYLQKAGLNVCVLERRHVLGGAAVTEEIIAGQNEWINLGPRAAVSAHFMVTHCMLEFPKK